MRFAGAFLSDAAICGEDFRPSGVKLLFVRLLARPTASMVRPRTHASGPPSHGRCVRRLRTGGSHGGADGLYWRVTQHT